jgi:serine/threonine protein kinase
MAQIDHTDQPQTPSDQAPAPEPAAPQPAAPQPARADEIAAKAKSAEQRSFEANVLPDGTILDEKYEITGILGRGGFAIVYRATQLNINRTVAIKVAMINDRTSATDIERFMREAHAAASLQHPNTVTVHDIGVLANGSPYIAMEPFVGRNLKRELRKNGPLSPARGVPLFINALDALAAAHEAGIIHRDLKPENLILTHPGKRTEALKIIDFGIARLHDSENVDLTGSALLGTPAYLAPEYIKDHKISPAIDVYQMGLILVELLTGQRVVSGENTFQCVLAHVNGTLNLPAALMASTLGDVLRKALQRDERERYPNAGAFRDALEAVNLTGIGDLSTAPGGHDERSSDISLSSSSLSTSSTEFSVSKLNRDTFEQASQDFSLGDIPRPQQRRKGVALIALVALVVLSVSAALLWIGSQTRSDEASASTSQSPPDNHSASANATAAAQQPPTHAPPPVDPTPPPIAAPTQPAPQQPPDPNAQPPAEVKPAEVKPAEVKLVITSKPSHLLIIDAITEQPLGETPFDLTQQESTRLLVKAQLKGKLSDPVEVLFDGATPFTELDFSDWASATQKHISGKPSSGKPSSGKPSSGKPSSDKPSSDKPSSDKPSSAETSATQPPSPQEPPALPPKEPPRPKIDIIDDDRPGIGTID